MSRESTQPPYGTERNAGEVFPRLVATESGPANYQVLVVCPDPQESNRIAHLLANGEEAPYAIDRQPTLADAARSPKTEDYDAIILDLDHAQGDRLKAIRSFNELVPDVPMILYSADDDENIAVEALGAGAQDYIVKGSADSPTLRRAIRFAIERKAMELRLHAMASYDKLTQLPNRELLLDRLTQAIGQAARRETMVGLLLLDLDRFKLVNDTLGHAFGDELLKAAATQIKVCLGENDTLARLGGDEFVVLLTNINSARDAGKIAHRIIDQLSMPITLDGREVFVSASIGISLFPNDGMDKHELITNADVAMYRAKEEGRNHFQFYTYGMNAATVERLTLENDLRRAVERHELLLHYQPQLDIATGQITGMEALVRWQHPDLGLVPPARFIPIAEETGLIAPIGQWVLKTACAQTQAWVEAGYPPVTVSVNLSSRQFHQEDTLRTVTDTLRESGLDPRQLVVEITESSLMKNPDDGVVTLNLLHNMGVGMSIDDFGTGYSSLGHLKRFPLETLKIDRSFVDDVTENPEDAAIVRAILAMAHSLNIKVVAEGVETEKQLQFLKEAGCDGAQGFHIGRPMPSPEFAEQFLKSDRKAHLQVVPKRSA